MTDQQNLEASRPVSADPAVALAEALGQSPTEAPKASAAKASAAKASAAKPAIAGKTSVEELAGEHGLKLGDQNELTIRRIKRGKSYSFVRANGTAIRHAGTVRRRTDDRGGTAGLSASALLAGPEFAFAGGRPRRRRPAAIPLSRRLGKGPRAAQGASAGAKLVAALPKIRRNVSMHLSGDEPTREFALAAVIELIARTAIRPGNESDARLNGTRGATTLHKSNVTLEDDCVGADLQRPRAARRCARNAMRPSWCARFAVPRTGAGQAHVPVSRWHPAPCARSPPPR